MTSDSLLPDAVAQARITDEYESPVSSYQILLRLKVDNAPGNLGSVASTIGECGGDIGPIDIHEASRDHITRDFRVYCRDSEHARDLVGRVNALPGVEVLRASDRTFQLHRGGKIAVMNKVNIRTNAELSHVYTPGVARVSMQIHEQPDAVWSFTARANTVAVVTDGTAVLGLGDIGPEAALPVMEGKCMLFKSFGNIDAWPICLSTQDPQRIIETVEAISPDSAASCSRTSPPPAASRSRTSSSDASTFPSSTTTSTAPPSSSSPRLSTASRSWRSAPRI